MARLPSDCPPWVLGQELGWHVASPLTLTMYPLDDLGVAVPDSEDLHRAGRRLGRTGMWQRGKDWIAANADWLHLGDYTSDQGWQSMFAPNGAGTLEWRLGFAATLPDGMFLMITPLDTAPQGLEVQVGIIASRTVNAMADRGGISIAVRPTRPVDIQRGQAIARLILLHPDSLRATTTLTPAPDPAPGDTPSPASEEQ